MEEGLENIQCGAQSGGQGMEMQRQLTDFVDVMFPPRVVFFSSAGLWWCKKLAEMQRSICIMVSLALHQPKAFHTAFPPLICFS